MKPGFAARRGAEEFNSLVEGTSVREPGTARYADFLELVTTSASPPRWSRAATSSPTSAAS